MENKKEFYPVGTIVLLKGATKSMIIVGYCPTSGDKMYDYAGCLYPEWIIDPKQNLLYNNDQIEKVLYKGLVNDECNTFMKKLDEVLTKYKNGEIKLPTESNSVFISLDVKYLDKVKKALDKYKKMDLLVDNRNIDK